jgi:hypothetical protein
VTVYLRLPHTHVDSSLINSFIYHLRATDLPVQYMWLKLKEWSDTYGPIYRTKMLGENYIIISDEKIAEELLKRAKIYADKPRVRLLFNSNSVSMEYLLLMGKTGMSMGMSVELPM